MYVVIHSEIAGQLINPKLDQETRFEHNLYTVGHYSPDGTWHPDSDWCDRAQAAERAARLNGGNSEECPRCEALRSLLIEAIEELNPNGNTVHADIYNRVCAVMGAGPDIILSE